MSEEFENEDLDFDMDEGFEDDAPVSSGAKSNVYTAMLLISAVFYVIALIATFAQMAPYCKGFLGS
jgi:hypothetical protein